MNKCELTALKVVDLRLLLKNDGAVGYSKLLKNQLIDLLSSRYSKNKQILSVTLNDDFKFTENIAAFDFDHTLVKPKNGNVFSKDINDWEWFRLSVPEKLIRLYKKGYCIIIFTNQSKDWKIDQLKIVLNNITFNDKPLPILAIIARDKSVYKPNVILFKSTITTNWDKNSSVFIGDALGRPNDFSDSDLKFATSSGFINIKSPEDFFPSKNYKTSTEKIQRKKYQEIVVLVGYQASGKTTLAQKIFGVKTRYIIISGDVYKSVKNMIKVGKEMLQNGKSVVFDATNPTVATRNQYIKLAKEYDISIRCIYLNTPIDVAITRNNEREKPVPKVALYVFRKKFVHPSIDEGFNNVIEI